MGFAGAYMPGLKALIDPSRPETLRAASRFTHRVSQSASDRHFCQVVADRFGWRSAVIASGLGPLLMIAVCLAVGHAKPTRVQRQLLDFHPVIRNRAATGYVLGYGAHCFGLYGIRTWLVAFWSFIAARQGGATVFGPVVVSVVFSLLSMPASVLGNEAALRFGRHRALTVLMTASAVAAVAVGLLGPVALWRSRRTNGAG